MRRTAFLALILLAGCTGRPPPEWLIQAKAQLEDYGEFALSGESGRAAAAEAALRREVARTGQLDLAARIEISLCAYRSAALSFDPCPAFIARRGEATAADRSYADFVTGDWARVVRRDLAPHYAALLGAETPTARAKTLIAIEDPAARAIAAAALLRADRADAAIQDIAIDTAAARGWRRPLLGWLNLRRDTARAQGDFARLTLLEKRIALVMEGQESKPR